jgi:hypothetical protein
MGLGLKHPRLALSPLRRAVFLQIVQQWSQQNDAQVFVWCFVLSYFFLKPLVPLVHKSKGSHMINQGWAINLFPH